MKQTHTPFYIYNLLKSKVDNKKLLLDIIPKDFYCTENIAWSELLIHQTELPQLEVLENLAQIANRLQTLRDTIFNNNSITITSAWRSEKYNKKIGGEPLSKHTQGQAVDIQVANMPPSKVQLLLACHSGGLGSYKNFTHIDISTKRRWTGA